MTVHQANTLMRLLVFMALSFGFFGFLAGMHPGGAAHPARMAAISGR